MNRYLPEGGLLSTPENHALLKDREGLRAALEKQTILEATALLCDEELTLHFDLFGTPAIMTREEAEFSLSGEGVKDIAVLTRVGKPVCFKIIGFTKNREGRLTAILSRRAAQKECFECYIKTLIPGDIIPSRVTHMENFGAFVDIACGIVALLSIDCISVSRIRHPHDRFSVGDTLSVVIKRRDDLGRIYVTHRELLGTWEENASRFSPGQTVSGIVRSVESYGIFVELLPNLAGLAELKEGVSPGDSCAVYIKSILPDKMKIKLILIDSSPMPPDKSFTYFIDREEVPHLEFWLYSPEGAEKRIETLFSAE